MINIKGIISDGYCLVFVLNLFGFLSIVTERLQRYKLNSGQQNDLTVLTDIIWDFFNQNIESFLASQINYNEMSSISKLPLIIYQGFRYYAYCTKQFIVPLHRNSFAHQLKDDDQIHKNIISFVLFVYNLYVTYLQLQQSCFLF